MSKMLTETTYDDASLIGWQEHFDYIYHDINNRRHSLGLWGRVIENMSNMSMLIRTGEFGEAFKRLSHVFCWVCACATKENLNLDDIIWLKYPNGCPYCVSKNTPTDLTCTCSPRKDKLAPSKPKPSVLVSRLKVYGIKYQKQKPKTLENWISMFEKIYGDKIYASTIEGILFHLSEEVGEVAKCLRKNWAFKIPRIVRANVKAGRLTQKNVVKEQQEQNIELKLELADVISQLIALVLKLRYMQQAINKYQTLPVTVGTGKKKKTMDFQPPEFSLSNVTFSEFSKGCGICKHKKCNCPTDILV
jgi:NTP pyrophosphatase (non-canonical NTP hydrolase)